MDHDDLAANLRLAARLRGVKLGALLEKPGETCLVHYTLLEKAADRIAALTRELAENDTAWERSRDIITGQYRDAMNALFSLKSEAMEAIERIERVPCADGAADSEAWRRQQDGRGAERMRAIATGLRARLSRASGAGDPSND